MRKSLRLFAFLFASSPAVVVLMTGAGVLSGLSSVGLVALITHVLYLETQVPSYLALGFAALILGKVVTALGAQLLLTRFTQGTILDLSLTLARRILDAPLRVLERRGEARVLSTLTDDVGSVTWSIQCIPKLAVSVAVVAGCGIYMAWLSWKLFLVACCVTTAGAIAFRVLNRRAFSIILAAREARSRLFEHFRTLTAGAKELKMHRARRDEFLDVEVRNTADEYRTSNLAATGHYAVADAFAQFLLYGLIGLLLFAGPLIARPTTEVLTGYVLTMLYMMSPLWTIIETLPVVARGNVALSMIEDLGITLDTPQAAGTRDRPATPPSNAPVQVEMKQVVFSYGRDSLDDQGFVLGPVDFHVLGGETVFVIGGNGSGKSTFVKVLAGLYAPQGGEITLNGKRIDESSAEMYREHFSVVFTDFHLFRKLLGISQPDLSGAARKYLELLRIDGKVCLQGREFSTTDLSQGQRKRLALVTAYLEDRPVYVFDEWAADQDPEYKETFYRKLLPDLRARGKAVVVITHDDRYFSAGDRVVRLEDGRMVADIRAPLTEPARPS